MHTALYYFTFIIQQGNGPIDIGLTRIIFFENRTHICVFSMMGRVCFVIVTCKTEEDPFKNEGARVVTKDLPL